METFSSTDQFIIASDPDFHCLMDWDTLLPKCFLEMPLKASISAVALTKRVIDCWHWKPVQQAHFIRRLEQPDFKVGQQEHAIVWAAVVHYGAFEVGDWMTGRGFPADKVPPDDK